jgi:hypothetical protein
MVALAMAAQEILHGACRLHHIEIAGQFAIVGHSASHAGNLAHLGAPIGPLGKRCRQFAHDGAPGRGEHVGGDEGRCRGAGEAHLQVKVVLHALGGLGQNRPLLLGGIGPIVHDAQAKLAMGRRIAIFQPCEQVRGNRGREGRQQQVLHQGSPIANVSTEPRDPLHAAAHRLGGPVAPKAIEHALQAPLIFG